MQGHVRKRHNRDGSDRRTWHEKTFRTKREAEDLLQSEQGAQLRGDWISPRQSDRPFSEVIEAWKESWSCRLSPTTARRYDSAIDNYLEPKFGKTPVGRITHEAVQRYVNGLASEQDDKGKRVHAPGTVRNVFAVLRTAMAKGVRLGMVKVNPCTDIDLPRARRQEMLFLTGDEVRAVAEKIDAQYRVLIYVAAFTGLRAGELGGLQRQDVDLLRGVLHVRRALKDLNGHLELGPTKTHAQRTIALPTFLRTMMEAHLLASDGGPEDFVFRMKGGGPMRHGLVFPSVEEALAEALDAAFAAEDAGSAPAPNIAQLR